MKPHESMRVAVLLFSDLVGSVSLQGKVGTQAYSRMLARHNEIFRQAVESEGRGRILNYTGDGFLAELPSPTEAVNAALRFQWMMNHERWEHDKLTARTAVHLGEIAELRQDTGDVRHVGMAINQVARLMDLAQGNQILVSRSIWDDARRNVRAHPPIADASRQPEISWKAHGYYSLKGSEEPVEVFEVGARGLAPLRQPPDSAKAARIADLTPASTLGGTADDRSLLQRVSKPSDVNRKTALICTGVTAAVGVLLLLTGALDAFSYDLSYLLRSAKTPAEVVVVEMDSASTFPLNQPSDDKWDRRLHAQILRNLARAGAKAVAFDIIFSGPARDPVEDAVFKKALADTRIAVLGAPAEKNLNDASTSVIPPYQEFRNVTRWGVVERATSGRRILRPISREVPDFAPMNEVAAKMALGKELKPPAGVWLNYYGPPGTIAHKSFINVLSNEVPASVFSNKVVYVGANTAIGFTAKAGTDYFISPSTRWTGKEMPGVEVNATSYANLVRNDWLHRLPPIVELLAVLLFGVAAGYALLLLAPLESLIATVATAAILAFALSFQTSFTKMWFPSAVLCLGQLPVAFVMSLVMARTRRKSGSSRGSRTLLTSTYADQTAGTAETIESRIERPNIPDHEALRCIGHGAYGEVWLARDALGSFHAVKILRRAAFKEEAPFEREFKGLQRYTPLSRSHPGLVHILHVGRNDAAGYIYYVMEVGDDQRSGAKIDPAIYFPRNLSTDIGTHGRIPLTQLIPQAIAVADGLGFLHKNGLIHRDIKPANIIFVDGKPKLADVGLVTEIGAPGDEISFIGTPGYMPPEGPGAPAGDVFSLGKSLYVAATGRAVKDFPEGPGGINDPDERAQLHAFMQIVLRACEPIAAERYKNAEEFMKQLQEFQKGFEPTKL